MKIRKISKKQAVRVWILGVSSLIGVCLLSCLALLILDLTAPVPSSSDDPIGAHQNELPTGDEPQPPSLPVDTAYTAHARVLDETPDAGQAYIDRMVFVGESTTAHLRSRGVLSGGTDTQQVWSNRENTMTLDLNMLQKSIRYPATGEDMTIPAAAALAKPDFLVLCFGVNGLNTFRKNAELYQVAYGRLIEAIHEASPSTVVLLQTVYPVATNQTTFSDSASEVNAAIEALNALLPEIAQTYDAYVVDTASVLKDAKGMLRAEYQNGDGLHLETVAYRQILNYLRTHAYTAQ